MNNHVAVLTINWNGWKHTLECLASLRASHGVSWRLYVVDNASTDDSIEHLSNLGNDVVLIRSELNGGWTGGTNLGIRCAINGGFDQFFILNNDAVVEPDTLATLLAVSSTYATPPVLGPLHRNPNTGRFDFVGAGVDQNTGLPTYKSGSDEVVASLPETCESSFVSGAAMLISRSHLDKIGFFDDDFFLNYDETDWCYRAREAGVNILIVKAAKIRHAVSASIGGMESPLNIYFMTRNGLLFSEKHSSVYQRLRFLKQLIWRGGRLTHTRSRVLKILQIGISQDPRLKAFRAGWRDYLLRRFGDCPQSIRTL